VVAFAQDTDGKVAHLGLYALDDKKRTMDYSLMLACLLVNTMNNESRSALPDAPVIPARSTGQKRRRLARLQGRLSSALHQAAWAIEPDRQTVPRPATVSAGVAADEKLLQ
jgi:hypothetical protein